MARNLKKQIGGLAWVAVPSPETLALINDEVRGLALLDNRVIEARLSA